MTDIVEMDTVGTGIVVEMGCTVGRRRNYNAMIAMAAVNKPILESQSKEWLQQSDYYAMERMDRKIVHCTVNKQTDMKNIRCGTVVLHTGKPSTQSDVMGPIAMNMRWTVGQSNQNLENIVVGTDRSCMVGGMVGKYQKMME